VPIGAAASTSLSGSDGYGFWASNGGALNAQNGQPVTTTGGFAIGVIADGLNSRIVLNGGNVVTTGNAGASDLAYGLFATNGGTI
jgi:hypothetical protein